MDANVTFLCVLVTNKTCKMLQSKGKALQKLV